MGPFKLASATMPARAILAVFLVGCETADVTQPDAAPEMVGLLDGEYRLAWTCVDGCTGSIAPMTTYNRLSRDGDDLRWWTEGTTNSNADVVVLERDGCVGGAGLRFGSQNPTEPYVFCAGLGAATSEVAWRSRWGEQQRTVWLASASRS